MLPDDLASFDFEAHQSAFGAQHVNAIAIHGGGGARADRISVHQADVVSVPLLGPEDAAGFLIKTEDTLGAFGVERACKVGDKDASVGYRWAGESAFDRSPPLDR